MLFDGALWGQSDALSLLAIVVALLYTLRHRGVPAGALFAAAVLFKPQPFVFGPLILFYLWRWAGGREALRALAAMAGTGLALCLPFLLPPHPEILVFLRTARDVALVRPFATLDGYNVWWFMGDMRTNVARPLVGPLSATVIGWLLFALVALVVAIGLWRDPSGTRLFLGAALLATVFFDVTTLQRDRYLFPTLALFLLATIGDVRALLFYATATVTAFLNMAMAVLVNVNPPADGIPSDPGINLNAQSEYFVHHGLPTPRLTQECRECRRRRPDEAGRGFILGVWLPSPLGGGSSPSACPPLAQCGIHLAQEARRHRGELAHVAQPCRCGEPDERVVADGVGHPHVPALGVVFDDDELAAVRLEVATHLLQHCRLLAILDEVQRIGHQDAVERGQIQRVGEVGPDKVDVGIGIALREGAALAIERTGIAVHREDLDLLAEHVA